MSGLRMSKAVFDRAMSGELLEADIQKACVDYLAAHGWRHVRTDPVSDTAMVSSFRQWLFGVPALNHVRDLILSGLKRCGRGKGFGEVGMADSLFVRYSFYGIADSDRLRCVSQVMWIEWKRVKKGKATGPTDAQREWHILERHRGGFTLIAGVDFPASIEGFRDWYTASQFGAQA